MKYVMQISFLIAKLSYNSKSADALVLGFPRKKVSKFIENVPYSEPPNIILKSKGFASVWSNHSCLPKRKYLWEELILPKQQERNIFQRGKMILWLKHTMALIRKLYWTNQNLIFKEYIK